MTPEFIAALDRTKMPDRKTVFTIAATATNLRYYINYLTLSVNNLRRARRENRKKSAEKDKQKFLTCTTRDTRMGNCCQMSPILFMKKLIAWPY